MAKRAAATPSAADRDLAYGAATDTQQRKAFWVDEMGTIRTHRLWYLVESITNLRTWTSKKLESIHNKLAELGSVNEQLQAFEKKLNELEARLEERKSKTPPKQ